VFLGGVRGDWGNMFAEEIETDKSLVDCIEGDILSVLRVLSRTTWTWGLTVECK